MQIDKLDSEIIQLLQKDGRMTSKAMSKLLDVTETTIRNRLSRLIKDEVIQIVAVADPHKIGFNLVGSFKINADPNKVNYVISELKKIDEIWYVAKATGSYDIDTEFNIESMEMLDDLIYNKLVQIDGIIKTETSIIFGYEKRSYEWGTAYKDEKKKPSTQNKKSEKDIS